MTLEDCEDAYLKLSKRIFAPRREKSNLLGQTKDFMLANRKFDAKVLETAIIETIKVKFSEDVLLKNQNSSCKVYASFSQV